jgi:long-chain acyl-CoA synthetase
MNALGKEAHTGGSTGLALFQLALARAPDSPALYFFDATITYRDLDARSTALAVRLAAAGFAPGDRVALYLQNMPQFVIALIASWKALGICVPINVMNREREVALIFADCRPAALICLDELYDEVITKVDARLLPKILLKCETGDASYGFVGKIGQDGPNVAPQEANLLPGDLALLVYTSGTTGVPKGAMISHGAFAFNSHAFHDVAKLAEGDAILGIAPLFHITGLVACFGSALVAAAPMVLIYRFETKAVLAAIDARRPQFVVAAITAFIALYHDEAATRQRLAGLRKVYSGGAPVPPGFVAQFEAKFGHYIHNCYGLTETSAPTHIVPLGARAPVSERGGVLSIGQAAPGVRARIVDDSGAAVPAGEKGELVIEGPMVSPGYWNNPGETAANMQPDGFRTGDVAFVDRQGWFYLVDRKKDVIISSGYKVWPREVEDVLYSHPSVREAAVVGVPDAYRGETVKAVISLKPGAAIDAAEVVAFCRARMAAYKYPRRVEILEELPKTPTGKILRRELR